MEPSDAAKHATTHRTAPATANYLAQNVSRAEAGKTALSLLKDGIKVNTRQTVLHLVQAEYPGRMKFFKEQDKA